jgi:putative isomerase
MGVIDETTFDVSRTPFSRFGSYFAIAYRDRADLPLGAGLYLRSVHGHGVVAPELFRIDWADGQPIELDEVEATPSRLTLRRKGVGKVVLCIPEPGTVRIHGEEVGLRLEMPLGFGVVVHPSGEGRWVVNTRPSYRRTMVERLRGNVEVDAPTFINTRHSLSHKRVVLTLKPDAAGVLDVAIDEFGSTWVPRRRQPFETCLSVVEAAFEAWMAGMPAVPEALQPALVKAAYVDWSCVVDPHDRLIRPSMLMSKNHMCQVWSWDNCFNAMALSFGHPELAWDQLMVMVDHQDSYGAFPDAVNDLVRHYNFSKPPVHGWALSFMREQKPAFFVAARLREIYGPFCRWANWWLTHRVAVGERLPHYLHGNDSGWDNSTMFDKGVPLIAPDLAALLALHCIELADLAEILGEGGDALQWRETGLRLIADLIHTLWREDHFVAMRQSDHQIVESDSLIPCIPIVLGKWLPPEFQTALVAQIRRFMTNHGLATEHPESPHYAPDGYWRGPIWAPSTLLIVSGLESVGETELARAISERFCAMCAKHGFAENFDALTGEGLRDPAYTWTASVFIILAHKLASE